MSDDVIRKNGFYYDSSRAISPPIEVASAVEDEETPAVLAACKQAKIILKGRSKK